MTLRKQLFLAMLCLGGAPALADRRIIHRDPCGGIADACLITLGTGTPVPLPEASGPATAIVVGERTLVFDAGAGVVRRMAAAGLAVDGVTAAFITHLHSDHTVGLPDLILSTWVVGRTAPMKLFGPPGLRAMTDHLLAAYAEDIQQRTNGLEQGHAGGERVDVREVSGGVAFEAPGIRVTAIPVSHGSWPVALGYRIDAAHRRFVISGDTRPSAALEEAARDADVLVHEAYPAGRLKPEARPGGEHWVEYMHSFHTSDLELGALAARARVKHLVVHHVVWMGGTPEELLANVRRGGYTGPISIAKDLDAY